MAEKAVERTVQKTNEKRPNSIVAIIDIGSNEIRMRIAERNKSGMIILENMQYPLSVAKNTFGKGSISVGKANKLCDILVNFMAVCKE